MKVLVVISAGNEGTVVSSPANCPDPWRPVSGSSISGVACPGPQGRHGIGPGWQLREHQRRTLPVLAGYDVEQWHHHPRQLQLHGSDNFNRGPVSAPIVSGIAALMLSRNNNLSTNQMLARLREGARPFPAISDTPNILTCHLPLRTTDIQTEQCLCTTAALRRRHVDAASISPRSADHAFPGPHRSPGQNVNLSASASAASCGRSVACLPGRGFTDGHRRPFGCEYRKCLGHRSNLGIDHVTRDRRRRSGSSRCRAGRRRAQSHHLRGAGVRRSAACATR